MLIISHRVRRPVSNDVTGVSCTNPDGSNNIYVTCERNTDGTDVWIELIPTDELVKYYDGSVLTYFTLYTTLTCPNSSPFAPMTILVLDENNNPPVFDPHSNPNPITLPYSQAPINWNEPVRVRDKDFNANYTETTFQPDNQDLIRLEVRRIPSTATERLEYYELFYYLQDNWDSSQGFDGTVTITATNTNAGPAPATLAVPLKIEVSPDVTSPEIQEEPYYASAMQNVAGQTLLVASVSDDRDNSLDAQLEGPLAAKFEDPVSVTNGEVTIRLSQAFTQDELEANNHVIRVTLVVSDDAGNENSLSLAIPFEVDEAPVVTEDSSYHGTLLPNTAGQTVTVAMATDESVGDLTVEPSNTANFGATIDPATGAVTLTLTSPIDPQVLADSNYLIRLTLKVRDSTNQYSNILPIALLFERAEVKATVDNPLVVLSLETNSNIAKATANPADGVTFSINPDDGKIALDPTTGDVTATYTNDEIVENAGKVNIYTIIASRLGGIAISEVTFVVSFKPDGKFGLS